MFVILQLSEDTREWFDHKIIRANQQCADFVLWILVDDGCTLNPVKQSRLNSEQIKIYHCDALTSGFAMGACLDENPFSDPCKLVRQTA